MMMDRLNLAPAKADTQKAFAHGAHRRAGAKVRTRDAAMVFSARLAMMAVLGALVLQAALPAMAQDRQVKDGPLANAFPALTQFLALPVGERNLFKLDYCPRIKRDGFPTRTDVTGTFSFEGKTWVLATDDSGCFAQLPSLAQLKANPRTRVDAPIGSFSLKVRARLAVPMALSLPTAGMGASLRQADQAARKALGMFALGQPKTDLVYFEFPDNANPVAVGVRADGTRVPLPLGKFGPAYQPDAPEMKGVVRLEFSMIPTNSRFGSSRD